MQFGSAAAIASSPEIGDEPKERPPRWAAFSLAGATGTPYLSAL
jgi:hypothetical protein